jgi:hypothetical protein
MQGVGGDDPHGEGRGIGAAYEDGAGLAQIGDDRRVLRRHEIGERDGAVVGGMAAMVDVDLGRHRHAVQRPQRLTPGARRIAGVGGGQGLVVQATHDGVQGAVHGVDARQAGRHRVAAGDLPQPDGARQIGRVKAPEVHPPSLFVSQGAVTKATPRLVEAGMPVRWVSSGKRT